MRMWLQCVSAVVAPDVRRLVFALDVYSSGAPVVLLARYVVATFQHEDALSSGRKPIRQRSPAGAASDYDDVVMIIGHYRPAILQKLHRELQSVTGARANLAQAA